MGAGEARTRGREDTRTRRANAGTTERWPCRVQRRSPRRNVMPHRHLLNVSCKVQERGFVRSSLTSSSRAPGRKSLLRPNPPSTLSPTSCSDSLPTPSELLDGPPPFLSVRGTGRSLTASRRPPPQFVLPPHPSPPLQLKELFLLPSLRSTRRSERPLQVVSRRPRMPLRLPRTKLRSFVPSLTFCALLCPPPGLTTPSPLLVSQQKAAELKGDAKVAAAEAKGKAREFKGEAKAELKDAELRGAEIKSGQQ